MKLKIKAFALALGLVYGFILFIGTWWLLARGYPLNSTVFLSTIYPSYKISPLGSVLGLGYGFLDGLIFGALFAWLYNLFLEKEMNR
jgi:hypothetical protein